MTRCPTCKQDVPPDSEFHPFCSGRCKDIDLGHWLNEDYRVSRPANDDELPEVPEEEEKPLLH